jgi:hypothetical protein
MLAQLDLMQVSTPASPAFTAVSSYVVGPLDPTQFITMHAQLSTGEECSLLVPAHLPAALLAHPAFKVGYEWGYLRSDPEAEEWTVPKLLNNVYASLCGIDDDTKLDGSFWPGFVLGRLAGIAEQNQMLALTGLAHFRFLFPLFTQDRPADWPRYEPYHPVYQHDRAVKAYRTRVRVYREQGKSYDEAQQLALATNAQ